MLKQLSYLFFLNTVLFVLIDFDFIEVSFIKDSILGNWESTIALVSLVIGITLFQIAKIKKTT